MQRWLAGQSKTGVPEVDIGAGIALMWVGLSAIANWDHAGQYGGRDAGGFFIAFGVFVLATGLAGQRERRSAPHSRARRTEDVPQRLPEGDDPSDRSLTVLQRGRGLWYVVLVLFVVSLVSGERWEMALGGLVLASFSLAVVINVRGLADAFSARRHVFGPRFSQADLPSVRTRFLFFAAIGALVFFGQAFRLFG